MSNPKISVVTVCYNAVDTIEETIQSVITQTYQNIEYIIVDGASTDATLDVIKKYEGYIDKWLSEPDNGIYDAMNKSVRLASGNWIIFLNSGDIFYKDSILVDVAHCLINATTIYYGNVLMLPKSVIYDGAFSKNKLCRHNICHQSIFYPRSVFNKHQYDLRYKVFADHAFNMDCMADKNYRFEYVDIIISVYSLDGVSSVSPEIDVCFKKDYPHIVIRNFGLPFYLYSRLLMYMEVILHKLKNQLDLSK